MEHASKVSNDESVVDSTKNLNSIFAIALIALVSCWYFASPGPFLRSGTLDFPSACQSAVLTFVCLFLIPCLGSFLMGIKPVGAERFVGQWRSGLLIVAVGVPMAGFCLFVGSDDPEILAAYPWPGKWLAKSVSNMLIWFAVYALYYFAFEFFFRSFLLFRLERELGLTTAMWIQLLLSVAIHFGKPTPELLASIPAGFAFGFIAWHTKSIWYVFLLHWAIGILNDIFAMQQHGWFDAS